MNLPIRYANFPKPIDDVFGALIPNKRSVASWLWAKPRLLGWRLEVHWLWSSPTSLFGLDETGSLIIVRIGTDDGTAPNPFEKSLADIKSVAINRSWSAGALHAEWLKRRARTSICCYGSNDKSVEKCLKLRECSGNPFPVFFGLFASSRSDFDLSREARQTLATIKKQAGDERAGVRVISARISSTLMRVQCRTPEST